MINSKAQSGWENQYPLNTFSGETKKELREFISNLLSRQRAEIVEEMGKKTTTPPVKQKPLDLSDPKERAIAINLMPSLGQPLAVKQTQEWEKQVEFLMVELGIDRRIIREVILRLKPILVFQKQEMVENICKLIDDLEIQDENTTMEQWKQYKHIRNMIRDKWLKGDNYGLQQD